MPRFVILHHETPADYARPTHFDLMLEHEAVLRTWALEKVPTPGETIRAEQLPDHRWAYLEYEGEIAGGRGSVSRVEAGEYEALEATEARFRIRLYGQRL